MTFITTLHQRWHSANTLLCVGLDPEPAKFPAGVYLLPRDHRCHCRICLRL